MTSPYYRVQHSLPLGETPAVKARLCAEGLWQLVTDELREVYYYRIDIKRKRRDFCAVGWPNENGGWEVRHPAYTGCIGSKGITFIAGDTKTLHIFADFTDYLCWRYYHKQENPSLLILNHPEFLPAARKRAEQFASVTIGFNRIPDFFN
ncbi:MAG TPA: hypothetical protein VHA52_07145 [Candidatus Babeliaceae bacterium]|nr:hypothetical protein [Candidatus Babeliaceae bacterium]